MSAPSVPRSGADPVTRADFRREALELARVQAATIALHDATSFLRNTYAVSTAALARALAGAPAGDGTAAEALASIQSSLVVATRQLETVVGLSTDLLARVDRPEE